ncbi:MAG: hypothetical protein GX628_08985 [Clostridiales bacterium]|nr:hypothetical protein [Clostridiales bacterium]
MKRIRPTSLTLLAAMLAASLILTLSACGDSGNTPTVTTGAADNGSDSAAETETTVMQYDYPDADYGGYEFRALNFELNGWDIRWNLDVAELTGEALDDAMYERNRKVEDKLNFTLKEVLGDVSTNQTLVRTAVLAGEDAYDITFQRADYIGALITDGLFYNLLEVPVFDFSNPWWEPSVIEESVFFGNILYYSCTDFNLDAIEGTWVIFFNEKIVDNLGLEKPYDLVRNGSWTLDKMTEYIAAAVNLNGDESFGLNPNGSCMYGITSYDATPSCLIYSAGERFVGMDDEGKPYFALETDRFYSVAADIAKLCGEKGYYFDFNNADANGGIKYEGVFKMGRAILLGGEIKSANVFRDMEDDFGLVPYPKYEESQEEYISPLGSTCMLYTIPMTNQDLERTAYISDAFAFETYVNVMPVYYDVTVSQKGLRNENSIEMLDLVCNTRFFDAGVAYGWTTSLFNSLRAKLNGGSGDVASTIASAIPTIEANIAKTMALIGS